LVAVHPYFFFSWGGGIFGAVHIFSK